MNTGWKRRMEWIAALAVTLVVAAPAWADPDPAPPRGYVDPGAIMKFASPDRSVVEVNLGGSMLRAAAKSSAKEDPDEAKLLSKLHSIRAYVIELEPGKVGEAQRVIDSIAGDLKAKGWETIASIRDKGERVYVLALNGSDEFEGLVVLMTEENADDGEDGPQLVFANIAGRFGMDELVDGDLDLPGLDRAHLRKQKAEPKEKK